MIEGIAWRGDVGAIYAPPTMGKSSLCTCGTVNMALAEELWGIEGWQCQDELKILLVDLENQPGESHASIQLAGQGDKRLENTFIWELQGLAFQRQHKK